MSNIDFNRPVSVHTISTGADPGKVGVTEGRLGGHEVSLGTQAKSPSRLSEAASAIKGFFSTIGNKILNLTGRISSALQELKTELGEQLRTLAFDSNRAALQKQLPPGVQVDDSGNLSGTLTTTKYPADPKLGDRSGMTFSEEMATRSNVVLYAIREGLPLVSMKDGNRVNKFMPMHNGEKITSLAARDFPRMEFQIGSGENNFDSSRDVKAKPPREKTSAVVEGLLDFTGSSLATSTLSTVLNRKLARPILESLTNPKGEHRPLSIEQGRSSGPFHMRNAEGELQRVDPGGIEGLRIGVDLDHNGDYTVTGSLDLFIRGEARGRGHKSFAGMDGALVKGEGTISFTIDAAAAKRGHLVFLTEPTVSVAFSGRMKS